jgi:hypothetical protein
LKPYKNEMNNKIEMLALTAGLVTLLSSLIFILDNSVDFLDIAVLFFLVLLNLKFIIEWIYQVLLCAKDKAKIFEIVSLDQHL